MKDDNGAGTLIVLWIVFTLIGIISGSTLLGIFGLFFPVFYFLFKIIGLEIDGWSFNNEMKNKQRSFESKRCQRCGKNNACEFYDKKYVGSYKVKGHYEPSTYWRSYRYKKKCKYCGYIIEGHIDEQIHYKYDSK